MRIIEKKRQRISTSLIVSDTHGKCFCKQYDHSYPQGMVVSEFQKAKKIYDILSNGTARTPQPLHLSLENKRIFFELIEKPVEFKRILLHNHNLLRKTNRVAHILRQVSKAVAKIHKELRYDAFELVSSGGDLVPLLGDICNSNILVEGKQVYLIDFSPTPTMYKAQSCNIMGDYLLDLAHLLYAVELPPLYHRPFLAPDRGQFERVILETYLKNRKTHFSSERWARAKRYYLENYKKSVCVGPLGIIWKTIIDKKLRVLDDGEL